MATSLPDRTARLLWGMTAACVAALALALVAQYVGHMEPCPWCVLQRVIYVVIGIVCAIAALARSPVVRVPLAGLALLLAVSGVAAALYQHNVAAASFSCNLTFADKVVSGLGLDSALPSVFSATASCAEASVSVLGVPFAYWSLVMFVLLAAVAAAVVGRSRRA
ncbi:MAG: disulfide bond formation protein B [Rhizobacter sp.]|jgi:disulfide bond formation protein DsbB